MAIKRMYHLLSETYEVKVKIINVSCINHLDKFHEFFLPRFHPYKPHEHTTEIKNWNAINSCLS